MPDLPFGSCVVCHETSGTVRYSGGRLLCPRHKPGVRRPSARDRGGYARRASQQAPVGDPTAEATEPVPAEADCTARSGSPVNRQGGRAS